ncbi:hypothetical protein B0A52_00452 [Exophiala mesophila]|uniref:Uncharacterized protein n=1 Tax=Exophiala mesophila TaxID=212818 RepID=A0A438NK49_EXOME|nr:hypothetical protein B0A52_00452 [Exophiala mesophila]
MHPIPIPGRRSFSLHDADVNTKSSSNVRTAHASEPAPCSPSITSSTSFTSSNTTLPTNLIYPLQPLNPPPERIPTPPGLPRFGSKEAQLYRLVPPSSHRFTSWSRRSSRRGKKKRQANDLRESVLRVAPVVGPLARADDGTWIRGRFPVRASGHGVGGGVGSGSGSGRYRIRARADIENGDNVH